MKDSNFIISLDHISKWFGDKQVLNDVNLHVKKGEFITILGPSGCGKTTLLRILAGFVTPDEGTVEIGGEQMNSIPPYKRPVNTVFQRYALFPHLNVYDNVAFGLKLNKVPEAEIEQRVRKALKMVNMTDYEWRDVESLSGGQQQRVAIARALINSPEVLLLDEPLSALDHKMRKDMQIELKEIHEKLGVTFLYVTHDQEEALTLSDTIVVMNDGVIQQAGSPIDIYNEPVNAFVADFIGESNILNGTMICDRKVNFLGHDFDCVDEGFGENNPVDVVIRPEDIYLMEAPNKAGQFEGTVQSCVFQGIHYEITVIT
ncbi:MAG: ABC transporter ATP-binding protein, partial [Bacteroidales bacterium]|nr:ABC transporter ATP-binding protein [Bacteroidales bacterium]